MSTDLDGPLEDRITRYYDDVFDEETRLTTRSPQGPLEFARTQEIIRRHLAAGRVLDVGGGTGHHARALIDAGYDVELLDPVPRHVAAAHARGVPARIGDARRLDVPSDSVDGLLLLGPLYHLAGRDDRLTSLREAARVGRPGGVVFVAGLSRFIAFATLFLDPPLPDDLPASWARLLVAGDPPAGGRFPAGHFHTAEELEDEVREAGLLPIEVLGVEGPGGLLLEALPGSDGRTAGAAAVLAEAAAAVPGIRDLSAHLLAVAKVP